MRASSANCSAAVSRLDGCVQSIFGGTTEIMKEIIGRRLGL
jgi:alkylation response protein AidB-like acyl-CoA dehydrogenase